MQGREDASPAGGAARYGRHRPETTLLYQLVDAHYPVFAERVAAQDTALPDYVQREFEDYLQCGRLEHGFLRVRCESCHAEHLLAFSCKRRGFCPSCGVRRMAESAALLAGKILQQGSKSRSHEIGKYHYDLGNELFEPMLGPNMVYTSAYWAGGARTREEAQNAKMDRVCCKLQLEPGMKLLDIGCGFGAFAKFAAENYGAHVTGISVSNEQLKYARKFCEGLPVEFRYQDYRDVREKFDRIASIGMFEAVGKRYFRKFMESAQSCQTDDGIFVLHTLGFNTSDYKNPWLTIYIFPGALLPR